MLSKTNRLIRALRVLPTLTAVLLGLASSQGFAQSIDNGRGELPLTVPENYNPDTPTPLVMLLHGYTSSGAQQDGYMGFSDLADRYGFLFIAPDGMREPGGDESRFWNASEACCDFYQTDVDDSSYLIGIIGKIRDSYNVDPDRIYLIGHSNGGFMSYRMAYEYAETIAAIASLAGANHVDDRPAPDSSVHVLQIHGTADGTIAYNGAQIQGNRYPSALETVTTWAEYNGCTAAGEERELRDLDASKEGHESTVMLFKEGCRVGGSAELWTIAEGSHVPPLSPSFAEQVIEWLYAHPKTSSSYSD